MVLTIDFLSQCQQVFTFFIGLGPLEFYLSLAIGLFLTIKKKCCTFELLMSEIQKNWSNCQ